jgi:hypothetical protein
MDNSFYTYIVIFLSSTFSIISVQEEYLGGFKDIAIVESSNNVDASDSFTKIKYLTSASLESHIILENFNIENVLEVETEIDSSHLHSSPLINNFRYCMTSTYNIYTVGIMRIEFLDIFSPPPNS